MLFANVALLCNALVVYSMVDINIWNAYCGHDKAMKKLELFIYFGCAYFK